MRAPPTSVRWISRPCIASSGWRPSVRETHHRQVVQEVDVPGVQLDEAHSKLRPQTGGMDPYGLGDGELVSALGRLRPAYPGHGSRADRAGRRSRAGAPALSHGWVEGLYARRCSRCVGVVYRRRRRGKVGRKPKPRLVAPKHLFYAQVVKVRNTGGPCRGGQQARGLRWSAPFWQAVASAAARHDDPDSLHGTLVWHLAWAGRAPAAPHPVSVLEPRPPPREGLAHGQPLQLCDAA